MKLSHALWGHPRLTGHGGEVRQIVVHWRREWQTTLYSCLENPMNTMKRQNDRILKEELPRSVGAKYATGDQWRNNSRKNEGMKPKQKPYLVVDVTDDRSKVRCCKEQYCIGTWNVRSVNQGKLEVVKQEMARVNVDYVESWVPKNWCFWTVVLEKSLESPLECKEIKPVNPKGNQSWIFIEKTDTEAETSIVWSPDLKNWLIGKGPDCGKEWRQEEKGMTEDEMVGWHHWLNGHEFEQVPGACDGHGGLACCSPWSRKESNTTEWLNWLNWSGN